MAVTHWLITKTRGGGPVRVTRTEFATAKDLNDYLEKHPKLSFSFDVEIETINALDRPY